MTLERIDPVQCKASLMYTLKHLKSAVSFFRDLLKMTYWRILILAVMI